MEKYHNLILINGLRNIAINVSSLKAIVVFLEIRKTPKTVGMGSSPIILAKDSYSNQLLALSFKQNTKRSLEFMGR